MRILLHLAAVAMFLALPYIFDHPKPTPTPLPAVQEAPKLPEPIDCAPLVQRNGGILRLKRASDGKVVRLDVCFVIEAVAEEETK